MKIMIVDDEVLLRIAIRAIVEKKYTVVGESSNAEQALSMAERLNPDIMIVDIIMPGINGMELIGRLRDILPRCKYIILSNIEDMEYCKKAIRYGVSDYLIKSETQDSSLLTVLDRIAEDIERTRVFHLDETETTSHIDQYLVLQEFLRHTMNGRTADKDEIRNKLKSFDIHVNENDYYVLIFESVADSLKNIGNRDAISNICQEIVNDMGDGVVFLMDKARFAVLFSNSVQQRDDITPFQLAERIIQTVLQIFGNALCAGISSQTVEFCHICTAYSQAEQALRYCFYDNELAIECYKASYPGTIVRCEKFLAGILEYQYPQQCEGLEKDLRELLQTIKQDKPDNTRAVRNIYAQILYHIIGVFAPYGIQPGKNLVEITEDLENTLNIDQLHNYSHFFISELLQEYQKPNMRGKNALIDRIYLLVYENLAEISLDRIAGDVFMSRAYICRVFKRETGGTLHQYIVAERLKRARQMLISGCSMKQTVYKVGFSSESYFIKCFRMSEGMTPGQFVRNNAK